MAKELFEAFIDSAETQIHEGKFPIFGTAMRAIKSNRIKLTPIGEFNNGTDPIPEYAIQRMKRIKEKDIDNTNRDKLASDQITILDSASSIDWETIKTARTTQKQLLIKVKKGEGENATGNPEPYSKTIATKTKVKLVSKEERAVDTIVSAGTEQVVALADLQDPMKLAKLFMGVVDDIEDLVDEYKYNANVVGFYLKRVGRLFARLEGQGYTQGTNTFKDGKLSSFTFENTEFYAEDVLKSKRIGATGTDADKMVLSIIMSDEAYVDAGLEEGVVEVNENLLRGDVVGHIYDDFNKVIDPSRIKYLTATIADLKTAGLFSAGSKVQPKINA